MWQIKPRTKPSLCQPLENRKKRKISAEVARLHAETEFEKYRVIQDRLFQSDFDQYLHKLETQHAQIKQAEKDVEEDKP